VRAIRLDESWAVRRWNLCVRDLAALPPAAARLVSYLSRA
jgi:hypothetical protein